MRAACFLAVAGLLGSGCATVQIHTKPRSAHLELDGRDISDEREFESRPGLEDYRLKVSAKGYQTEELELVREDIHPALRWGVTAASISCSFLSAGACCGLGACLGGQSNPRNLLGFMVGNQAVNPIGLVLGLVATQVLSGVATPWCMPGCMACGTLLGSWPLLGLLVPVFFAAPKDVAVKLKRVEDTPEAPVPPSGPAESAPAPILPAQEGP